MLSRPFFKELVLVMFAVAILHHLAIAFYFYYIFIWFDIPMHFLGGLFVGFSALYLAFHFKRYTNYDFSFIKSVYFSITVVLIIGLGWEVFEFFSGITTASFIDLLDTLKDIVMDTLGGLVSAYYALRFKSKINE